MKIKSILLSLLFALCFALAAATTRADAVFIVSFNTSSIAGGTYYVSFQLNNDNTAGNVAALSNFSFGGGSAGNVLTVIRDGNSTGDLNGGSISLTDLENSNDFSNRFLQQFSAGSNFGFRLVLTTNFNSGPDDLGFDAFRFSILDAAFNELATTDPVTGRNLLLGIDIDSTMPSSQQYELSAAEPVAEPATCLLLGTGLIGFAAGVRKILPGRAINL